MLKKTLALALVCVMALAMLSGCAGTDSSFKVGMVTDAGTIDDKSFNQGTWEGVKKAAEELKTTPKYVKPSGQTTANYMTEIGNLYDAGYRTIVTPGFLFGEAVFEAQEKYQDANFICIDFSPSKEQGGQTVYKTANNTVSISFAEHQSGFMAGLAAALQIKSGEFGGIYGMEIPPVQKFNWGFQQGVRYANDNYGTTVSIKPENIVYVGKFDAPEAGTQLAAQMYDRGVSTIFIAAGLTGTGAITEAKTQRSGGKDIWAVGVDVDQYAAGIYEGDKSVMLTSAMKCIDTAAYDMIKASKAGTFPGGQDIVYDAAKGGVGIPANNPNLSEDVQKTCDAVFAKIKSGELVVADTADGLIP